MPDPSSETRDEQESIRTLDELYSHCEQLVETLSQVNKKQVSFIKTIFFYFLCCFFRRIYSSIIYYSSLYPSINPTTHPLFYLIFLLTLEGKVHRRASTLNPSYRTLILNQDGIGNQLREIRLNWDVSEFNL